MRHQGKVRQRVLTVTSLAIAASAAVAGLASGGATAAGYAPVMLQRMSSNHFAPTQLRLGTDGSFYGIAPGSNGTLGGAVVRLQPDGTLTTLYDAASQTDPSGWLYQSVVQGPDGALYLAAGRGGANDTGVLSRLTLDGKLTVLHAFSAVDPVSGANPDGVFPGTLLIGQDGKVYGSAFRGGPSAGGDVFRLETDGSLSIVASFTLANGQVYEGGDAPVGLMQSADGALYSMTQAGAAYGMGALAKIAADGRITDQFVNTLDMYSIHDVVMGGDGSVYGIYDSFGNGVDFRISAAGQYAVIPSQYPTLDQEKRLFVGSDGGVYATGLNGGAFNGFLSKLTSAGGWQDLTYFGYPASAPKNPTATAMGADGNLYGVTAYGGGWSNHNQGISYRLDLPPPGGWGSGPQPVLTLSLSPSTVDVSQHQSATLGWTVANSSTCELLQSATPHVKIIKGDGSMTITPSRAGTYTYTLSCANNGVYSQQQAQLVAIKG